MSKVVYFVASSLDGYIADAQGSLDWLTSLEGAPHELSSDFMAGVDVQVMGSTTYQWLVEQEDLIAFPHKWKQFFGSMKTVVMSSRELELPTGAEIVVLSGDVREAFFDIRSLSAAGNIWLVGGGQLASQFLLAGLIDSVEITTAPVLLGAGVKLFASVPVHTQLRLAQSSSHGNFVHSRYDVVRQN